MVEVGPKVAIVDEDASRRRDLAELLEQAGYAAHAFASPRSAMQIAVAVGFDAMVVEHAMRELTLLDLSNGLGHRLGATAPPLVVLTRKLHEMPIPERDRYVAVLPAPVEPDVLVRAVETALARRARGAGIERAPRAES